MVSNTVLSAVSLFAYPVVSYHIGIASERSLAIAGRSVTLAFGIPAITNLGGDLHTVAALAIMSGIFGAILGPPMLKLLRIPQGTYVSFSMRNWVRSDVMLTIMLRRLREPWGVVGSKFRDHRDGPTASDRSSSCSVVDPLHESVRRDYCHAHINSSDHSGHPVPGWAVSGVDQGRNGLARENGAGAERIRPAEGRSEDDR